MLKPKVHSNLPTHISEKPFAEKLLDLDFPVPNQPHLWFLKMPGIKDIDAIIFVPNIGFFILEMKSWPLSAVIHISSQRFELAEWVRHSTNKNPWEQAQEEEEQFRTRLQNDLLTYEMLGKPWTSPVVALYNISRKEFEERFMGESGSQAEAEYKSLISNSTIFSEDLTSGEKLLSRLLKCREDPVNGGKPNYKYRCGDVENTISVLKSFLSPSLNAVQNSSAYDSQRLKILEDLSEKRLTSISYGEPIYCTGFAGTGKTLLGLQSALYWLNTYSKISSRKDVLYVCFNKVLATDIERLVKLSSKFSEFKFDAFDIFKLLKFLAYRCGIEEQYSEATANIWAGKIVDKIIDKAKKSTEAKKFLGTWGYIVVDEAQDLDDWV